MSDKKPKKTAVLSMTDDSTSDLQKSGYDTSNPLSPLLQAINNANGSANKKAPSLAFTEHPSSNAYMGLFKTKRGLLPDDVIKQIRVTDHLIAAILRVRGNTMSLFGHLRKDRFGTGIEVHIKPEFYEFLTPEQFAKVQERVKRLEKMLLNCGQTDGLEHQDQMTLAEWFDIQARNACSFGRFADEIIYDRSGEPDANGKFPFHRFRPVDVGSIVKVYRKGEDLGPALREAAFKMLESLSGEMPNLDPSKFREDEYAWAQLIDSRPAQAFTHDEMLVFNMYPSTDIEHNGYPVTPLDTVVNSVTTHISIDVYKKLYFQNGRASKGMVVIKSDEVDQSIIDNLKLQFNASINSVSNSFRTPIFGVSSEDDVQWLSMTGEGARDADFQFMYDQIARNILAAFSVSPDELPGYGHLSKGTNSQTLSESNNEFKMTAARDSGLRPMILKFQVYLNSRLLPLMDPALANVVDVKIVGLDAQSKEQESTRLQQDMSLHMGYDELLKEVNKDPVGEAFGGTFPFNERYQLLLDKYVNVGDIKSQFFKDPSAFVDPMNRYRRDPFFLQALQLMMQVNPNAVKTYFASRSPEVSMDFMKMEIEDMLEEDE